MKHLQIILGGLIGLLLVSCKDDIASAGAGALTDDEEVRVCAGTLSNIVSRSDSLQDFVITQTPDSFLLGEVNTIVWATIKADILAQFACPTDFVYPTGSEVDSVGLMMTYSSWFAEGNSPLRISVYELDKTTFNYDEKYTSSIDVYDYWSGEDSTHVVKDDQIVVAAHPNDSVYSSNESKYYPIIRFKMNERFVNKMNALKKFPSQEDFNKLFKGLYITTTWGASTALYVSNLTMVLYYHYPYQTLSPSGHDTTVVATDAKYLYANSEVRQVNRYSFPNKRNVVEQMQEYSDSVNFVVSPSYVYTVLNVPVKSYVDTILKAMTTTQGDTLQPYINKALMRVDVLNVERSSTSSDKWADPANDMLLIRRDSLQSFFSNNKLPSADYCILGSLTKTLNSDYSYSYYYEFDVSTMLYNEIHRKMRNEPMSGDLDMVMIPVHVEYSTSSSTVVVSRVKINQTITYTEIRSAQYQANPLDIDVVFSGFTINSLH